MQAAAQGVDVALYFNDAFKVVAPSCLHGGRSGVAVLGHGQDDGHVPVPAGPHGDTLGNAAALGLPLRRMSGLDEDADVRPMRTVISSLRRKLEDDSENPTYIFTELRVGYRMPGVDVRTGGGVSVEPCLTARGRPDGEAWWRLK